MKDVDQVSNVIYLNDDFVLQCKCGCQAFLIHVDSPDFTIMHSVTCLECDNKIPIIMTIEQ